MVTIDCDPLTISIVIPECSGAAPFTATLTRDFEDPITLTATLVDDQLTLSGIPADTRRGVWWLALENSCGCYRSMVFVDMCRTPRFLSTHTPTPNSTGEAQACCEPENMVGHFTVPPGEEPEITVVDGDVASATLEGTALSVVFTTARTGTVTVVNSYGDVVATGAIAASGTILFTLEETLPCDTYVVTFVETV